MFWIIPVLGLAAGILLGSIISLQIPLIMAKYLSIAVLAALDSALGGIRCIYENTFNGLILLTGFISNALMAALLALMGDQLNVDLYMAAVFVFGIRIFQNASSIRHYLLSKFLKKHNVHATQHADRQS